MDVLGESCSGCWSLGLVGRGMAVREDCCWGLSGDCDEIVNTGAVWFGNEVVSLKCGWL